MSSLSEYKANKLQLILKSRKDDSPGFPALCFQCRVFVFPWHWMVDFVGKEFEYSKEIQNKKENVFALSRIYAYT